MTGNLRILFLVGLLAVVPLAGAKAACDSEEARETTHIRYGQAMAAWQQNDQVAYEAAQEQLRTDAAKAKRAGAVQECQFSREKQIRAVHKQQ